MSGIAKPCMYFSGAQGTGANEKVVNVEDVHTIEKVDVPAFNGAAAKSQILVVMKNHAKPDLTFTFADATARNTSYTNAKTLIAAAVAAV